MQTKTLFLTMDDGAEVFIRSWAQTKQPRGVVQIAHGMAEHSGRYRRFAEFLNEQGFVVVANDHRGHGETGKKAGLMGYFAAEDGFDRVVDDLAAINSFIQQEHPDLPIFLMGHSMGSFLARRYIQKYGNTIRGAILMGSGGDPGVAAKAGKLIARFQMRKDPTSPSTFLDKLSFGSFNKGIKDAQTKFDWLSRDRNEVNKYIADQYCGMVCSSGFFYDLFTGLELIHNPELINRIPKDLPLLVVSGEADPVGKYGSGIRQFVGQLRNHNVNNIELKLYPGARHELLNEINRAEVMQDISNWLQHQLSN
ncbi:MAG: alpha/beta hydrolase [Firmicutes bacterium]|nr:alpha/beta hydrolase [Bacillota bacterium]